MTKHIRPRANRHKLSGVAVKGKVGLGQKLTIRERVALLLLKLAAFFARGTVVRVDSGKVIEEKKSK